MGITKITLYGQHMCNYVYIEKGALDNQEFERFTVKNFEPRWIEGTEFLVAFNNNLTAGNNEIGADFVGWIIYRKNITDDLPMKYVSTITDNNVTEVVDYMVANNKDYKYYLFLNTSDYIASPFVSNEDISIHTEWDGYTLITTDRKTSGDIDELKVKNVYYFKFNIETSEMSNNAITNKLINFTPYPKIQRSNSNYLSGTLKSLVGYMGDQCEYVETSQLINQLRQLSTDNTRKFLKDMKGNITEVEIDDSIKFSLLNDNIKEQPYVITLSWVEVGNADNVSVTYTKDKFEWVLTKTGTSKHGTQYLWLPGNTVEPNTIVTGQIDFI